MLLKSEIMPVGYVTHMMERVGPREASVEDVGRYARRRSDGPGLAPRVVCHGEDDLECVRGISPTNVIVVRSS